MANETGGSTSNGAALQDERLYLSESCNIGRVGRWRRTRSLSSGGTTSTGSTVGEDQPPPTTMRTTNDAVKKNHSDFSSQIFLTPDERYMIWTVKLAERPEIASVDDAEIQATDSHQDGDPALQDGCDLPGWRQAGLVNVSSPSPDLRAALRVGCGCTLLRRESQLPMLPTRSLQMWRRLQQKLLQPPTGAAAAVVAPPRLQYGQDDTTTSLHPWFERDSVPVVLDGCAREWRAMETYKIDRLLTDYGDREWRFSDTHGATMTLHTYHKYLFNVDGALTDDAPLAIYDSQLQCDDRSALLDDYTVPACFDADLFDLLDNNDVGCRPPWRWILIGPERSGTGLHVDPVGTHAWVTLVQGVKRWILFPPDTERDSIYMHDPPIPSAIWCARHYDTVMSRYRGVAVEVLQQAGETVYVPAHWPHLVLNLTLSVAITHNYASPYPDMSRFVQAVQAAEPELASRLQTVLECQRPELLVLE